MTLFALLISLSLERLFKMGDHWRISRLFIVAFKSIKQPSLTKTLIMTAGWLLILAIIFDVLNNLFFNFPLLILSIVIGWLCIGAGITRRHYRNYLKAASNNDEHAMEEMATELAFIHGLPEGDIKSQLKELQNALLWINYRYYLAPVIIFVAFGKFGAIALATYALLRSYQTWLARSQTDEFRQQSGIDKILHWIDWIPVRQVSIAYTFLGNGEKALPTLKAFLTDKTTSQYEVLTQLAQLSLSNQPQTDPVETPKAAVALAKKVSVTVIVIVSLLTIYGAIF